MKDFRFTSESPDFRIDEIVNYLTGPRLWVPNNDYPNIIDWAQKVYIQLKSGSKRSMVAYYGQEIVGVTIYQKHKQDLDALEIKNITIRPDMRGRHVASFLLKNTEIEGAKEYGSKFATCDAKVKNINILYFLKSEHYEVVRQTDLYNLGTGKDAIFRKSLIPLHIKGNIYCFGEN